MYLVQPTLLHHLSKQHSLQLAKYTRSKLWIHKDLKVKSLEVFLKSTKREDATMTKVKH